MNPIFDPSTVLAFQASSGSGGMLGALGGLVPMLLIFVIFYFLVMAADAQAAEGAAADDRRTLKKGDRVVTTGGLYGEVSAVDGATVILRRSPTTSG